MEKIDKLNKLASNNSKWKEEAQKRKENRDWQKHSQKIAIKILRAIREKSIKQKQLAKMIGVSPQQINKIVKGNENLTLQTITKLENALNIELIFTEVEKSNIIYREIFKKEPVYFTVYNNTKTVSQQTLDYSIKQDIFSENIDFEKAV
ncbi:MAG: helix-turn-helix transcriptional regulator [Bacteroidales bacterium]|jgi:transcriptional regulator with XRE-family HTH domain|nr:helix-turn-helix transcriptional regulator [Bacteroidales bacterium]